MASATPLSTGQYGHLNFPPGPPALPPLPPPRPSCSKLPRASTCPHGIIIGGFASVLCSLLTGHTKTLWKLKPGGSSTSTGSSAAVVHDVRCSCWISLNFCSVGSAMQPAVTAVSSGLAEDRESSEQKSLVNAAAAAFSVSGSSLRVRKRPAYGERRRAGVNASAPSNSHTCPAYRGGKWVNMFLAYATAASGPSDGNEDVNRPM